MSIQNGASTTTKLNGGIVMKNVLKGFKVFNANGEVVSYENQNNLVTELDLICVATKRGDQVEELYALPSPVYRSYQEVTENGIEQVKFSFANKLVEDIATQVAKVKANEKYEIEKQQRHAKKPLSNAALSKTLYEAQNMLEFIKAEDIISMEVVTVKLTDRILIVADDKEGYPISNSINYHTFKYLSLEDIKSQYDMVLFTDRTAFTARSNGQHAQRQELKIVRDYGYGVAFKNIEVVNRHLLANAYADDETLLRWLDNLRSKSLIKKQHTVYHVSIADIQMNEETNRFEYVGTPTINEFAASSHLLETLESNGYSAIVLNANFNDKFEDDYVKDLNSFKREEIFKEGFWMEIDGETVLCRRILQSSSQARTIKITFSTCPLDDFWNIRGQLSYGLIKEGDNLEPNKAEKRFGLASSTSIKASKTYKAFVMDDLTVEIEQQGHELVYDEEKSKQRGRNLFKVQKFNGRRESTPSDGQILAGHPILAQLTYDIRAISNDELMYWLTKTCSLIKIKTNHPSQFPFKVVDCKTMDEIYDMVQEDARLDSILKRIITAVQLRLNISDKGLAIMFDLKKYWPVIHEEIAKQHQAKGLPIPASTFDPEMFVVFASSHKLKTEGIFYDVEVRICNYTNSINNKAEKHRLSTQAFFSLDLPREIIKELADEELQAYQRAFNSIEDAIAVTGNYGRNDVNTILNHILTLEPTIAKKAFKNSYVQEKLYKFIEKQLFDLQYGQLLIKAETHYITCDPLYFFNPKNALKRRQAAFVDHNGSRVQTPTTEEEKRDPYFNFCCLIRHPHLNRTEKAYVKLVEHDELWYLRNILIINAYDDTFARMGGADVDGDKVMMIFERRVVANTKYYNQFIQQGISNAEKRKAGMIKGNESYHYDYEAINSAHNAGTEGTQIAEATNTILRTTELFSATDVSAITDKDLQTFRKEIYASIVQLCCMSGQLIDQAGIPVEERLYMDQYESDFWGKYPFISKSMVEYLFYKRGIKFNEIDDKYFNKYQKCTVVDLDTSFKYIIEYVRGFMNKVTDRYVSLEKEGRALSINTSDNRPLSAHIASHLMKCTSTTVNALDDVKHIASYWRDAASQISLLPNEDDDDKEIVNEAWDRLRRDMHELLLSIHPDPRMCAALTYFYCYGTGARDRKPVAQGLVWNCLLEEFIEFLNPNYSCMYLEAPTEATENDEVVVIDGALFLRRFIEENGQVEAYDFFIKRVGYRLSSNKLTLIGNKLHMTAIRPRSVMFDQPSSLVALRIKEQSDNRLLKLNTSYRLSFQKGKLFIYTMENALVGQVYASKHRFNKLDNTIIRVDRLACGMWQFQNKKEMPENILSTALVTILGEDENPYKELRETFTKEAIENGIKGYAIVDDTMPVMVDDLEAEDVISVYEETQSDDLMEVEVDFENDFDSYVELEDDLYMEQLRERSETLSVLKGSFTPQSTPTFEEEEPIDLYDAMEEWC